MDIYAVGPVRCIDALTDNAQSDLKSKAKARAQDGQRSFNPSTLRHFTFRNTHKMARLSFISCPSRLSSLTPFPPCLPFQGYGLRWLLFSPVVVLGVWNFYDFFGDSLNIGSLRAWNGCKWLHESSGRSTLSMATSLSSNLLLQVDGGCFRDKPFKWNNLPIATHHLVTFAADLPFSFFSRGKRGCKHRCWSNHLPHEMGAHCSWATRRALSAPRKSKVQIDGARTSRCLAVPILEFFEENFPAPFFSERKSIGKTTQKSSWNIDTQASCI